MCFYISHGGSMKSLKDYQKAVRKIKLQREKEISKRFSSDVGLDDLLALINQQGMRENDVSRVQWINNLDPFVKEILFWYIDMTDTIKAQKAYMFITLQCFENLFRDRRAPAFWKRLVNHYGSLFAGNFIYRVLHSIEELYEDYLSTSSSVLNAVRQAETVIETIDLLLTHFNSLASYFDMFPSEKLPPIQWRTPSFATESQAKAEYEDVVASLKKFRTKLDAYIQNNSEKTWNKIRFGATERINVAAFWARHFSYLARCCLPKRRNDGKRTSYNKIVADMLNLLYKTHRYYDNYVADKIRGKIDRKKPR